jgi:hypothetical protein
MLQLLLIFAVWLGLMTLATSGRGTTTDSSILQFVLGKAAYTAPAGCYAALFSATPTADNGTFTELTGSNYARATIDAANAAAAWSATTTDSTGVWKTNANVINFPTASAGWLAATGFGIYDAVTGTTNLLYWGTFASASTVGSGATASFAASALKVTEA